MQPERRAYPRHTVTRPRAALLMLPDGQVLGAAVPDNVSAGGIRVMVSQPRPGGELLLLVPQGAQPLAGRQLAFRVAHCEPLNNGHSIAGPFLTPLSEAEVQALTGA